MAACDPASLLEAVRCFNCIPAGMLASVGTNLLCQLANRPTGPLCDHPLVIAWMARVAANGGATPSLQTQQALCDFCYGLDEDLLTGKMISVNPIVPDNLIAARTPLITPAGINLWTENPARPWDDVDLTVDGLKGDGVGKFLNTGVIPNDVVPGDRDWGCTLYNTFSDNSASKDMGAVTIGSFADQDFQFLVSFANTSYFDCWDANTGRTNAANAGWTGFLTGNRTAADLAEIYKANSFNPLLVLVKSNGNVLTTVRPVHSVYVFGINYVGNLASPSARRFSFVALHTGLVKADAQLLYNRVQQLRIDLGGGHV